VAERAGDDDDLLRLNPLDGLLNLPAHVSLAHEARRRGAENLSALHSRQLRAAFR
jgi:hypothetical protein